MSDCSGFRMSATSSGTVVLSSAVGREKSVIWLNTYYFDLSPHTLSNFNPNVIWASAQEKTKFVNIELQFQFVRISELEFRITCIKSPISFAPTGSYSLQFQCSINVFDRKPEVFEMPSSAMITFQPIWLDASYCDNLSVDDLNKKFEMKIVASMIEYNCDSNERYYYQEAELQKAKERYFPNESVVNDLCYILDVPRFQNIFTGRQTNEFAQLKILRITRAAAFAKEIADFTRARRSCMPPPVIESRIIMNFILNGERATISNEGVIDLYYDGHHLGLPFLVHLCRSVIENDTWTTNINLNIDALRAADHVNDETLFSILEGDFHNWRVKNLSVLSNQNLFKSLRDVGIQCRFMVLTLERRRKMSIAARERASLSFPTVSTEGSSGQSPKILTSL